MVIHCISCVEEQCQEGRGLDKKQVDGRPRRTILGKMIKSCHEPLQKSILNPHSFLTQAGYDQFH